MMKLFQVIGLIVLVYSCLAINLALGMSELSSITGALIGVGTYIILLR